MLLEISEATIIDPQLVHHYKNPEVFCKSSVAALDFQHISTYEAATTMLSRAEFLASGLVPIITPSDDSDCSICCEKFTAPVRLPCSHEFCRECILHWLDLPGKTSCPYCRQVLFDPSIARTSPERLTELAFRELIIQLTDEHRALTDRSRGLNSQRPSILLRWAGYDARVLDMSPAEYRAEANEAINAPDRLLSRIWPQSTRLDGRPALDFPLRVEITPSMRHKTAIVSTVLREIVAYEGVAPLDFFSIERDRVSVDLDIMIPQVVACTLETIVHARHQDNILNAAEIEILQMTVELFCNFPQADFRHGNRGSWSLRTLGSRIWQDLSRQLQNVGSIVVGSNFRPSSQLSLALAGVHISALLSVYRCQQVEDSGRLQPEDAETLFAV